MTNAPERIWAWPDGHGPSWYSGGCSCEINLGLMGVQADEHTEYVRADTIEALTAEVAALRAALEPLIEALTISTFKTDLPEPVLLAKARAALSEKETP